LKQPFASKSLIRGGFTAPSGLETLNRPASLRAGFVLDTIRVIPTVSKLSNIPIASPAIIFYGTVENNGVEACWASNSG